MRKKVPIALKLDADLLEWLDQYQSQSSPPVTRTAIIETAVEAWLRQRGATPASPRSTSGGGDHGGGKKAAAAARKGMIAVAAPVVKPVEAPPVSKIPARRHKQPDDPQPTSDATPPGPKRPVKRRSDPH
jgi:hypothetical protein